MGIRLLVMPHDLRGRTVVITGASRGLGAGMAAAMARQGIKLGLCARTKPRLDVPGAAALCASVDMRDEDAVARFATDCAESIGPIDLWINNAGVLEPIAFVAELSYEALMAHLTINIGGVANGSKAYVRHVRARRGGGVLINVSSGAAHRPYAGWGAYCAGKAAAERLTEVIQLEERAHGLRAHAVAPGIVDTDMQRIIRDQSPDTFPLVDKFVARKKRGAFNTPAYVAEQLLAIAFDEERRPDSVVLRLTDQQPE
jgi:benzil reductase ((S)-benzoin forming)